MFERYLLLLHSQEINNSKQNITDSKQDYLELENNKLSI